MLKWSLDLIKSTITLQIIRDIYEMKTRFNETLKEFENPICRKRYDGPLVSVVVPTRNEERNITKLLISLTRQCYDNLEIIVADYKSTDRTREIAKIWGAKIVDVDKPGIGYATFVAVKKSKGEIIIRTDADTIFPPSLVAQTVEMFRNGIHVVNIGHIYYDGGFIENLMAFLYDKYWRKPWNTTGHFIAFSRRLLDYGLNFNPALKYDEDYDFGRRVYEKMGANAFLYDYTKVVLTSARRIKNTGLIRYTLGYRKR